MSKIVIAANQPAAKLGLVKAVRDVTGEPLSEIAMKLKIGKTAPIYMAELFLNDHPRRDMEIRALLNAFDAHGVEPYILELLRGETRDVVKNPESARMDKDVLLNILDESIGSFE
ncbi:MAG: hypothetical protein OEZ04_06750 [Nitrospinota bacterium]|nr:hypothetical protein [Nitrospinota bacterium]